tara:strand:+ start:361 stop:561 length:201 start_codon:yes stop_codon:yes gene_type:complete
MNAAEKMHATSRREMVREIEIEIERERGEASCLGPTFLMLTRSRRQETKCDSKTSLGAGLRDGVDD